MKVTVKALHIALYSIVQARDHCAEHGRYPASPLGPGIDQAFDDWAADVAEHALFESDSCPECGMPTQATGGATGLAPGREPYRLCPSCGWDSSPPEVLS